MSTHSDLEPKRGRGPQVEREWPDLSPDTPENIIGAA